MHSEKTAWSLKPIFTSNGLYMGSNELEGCSMAHEISFFMQYSILG